MYRFPLLTTLTTAATVSLAAALPSYAAPVRWGCELPRRDRLTLHGNLAGAEADLSDGALHAYAESAEQSEDCRLGVPHTCIGSYADATAALWDVVTFRAADLRDPSQVRWKLHIKGDEDLGPWRGDGGSTAKAWFAHHISTAPWHNDHPLF